MSLRVAMGQFNASVGDIGGNSAAMRKFMRQAENLDADVLVFPEMSLCGYPPEDLLLKKHFLADNLAALKELAGQCGQMAVIVGFPQADAEGKCFNSLAVLKNGAISSVYHKHTLPNYGVFDERRYFQAGAESSIVQIKDFKVVLTICEDIWNLDNLAGLLDKTGSKDLLINISASPFHVGKIGQRRQILARCAERFNCAIAYCNLVGGQDELVFDGRSMIVNSNGMVACQATAFEEDLLTADIIKIGNEKKADCVGKPAPLPEISTDPMAEVYGAIVLGTRDYVLKNGFKKVLLGLSGGIDSALVATVAVEALGTENVVGVTMPSKFNSPDTITDAEKIASSLGIEFHTIPIGSVLDEFDRTLSKVGGWQSEGIAYENLQARIRGCILMSLSNRFSYLVLTTGNKSETAVGYSTLYGDTAGGFAVIKDVPKTMVYQLCEYINTKNNRQIIPQSIIERVPSAELRPNQKDTDSLPDYDILDRIIKGYIEEDRSARELIGAGLPKETVLRVIAMVDRNEYKRRQSPPGVKITPMAFGKDRRMPIINGYSSIVEF